MKKTKSRDCLRTREDATFGGVVDKIISCPWRDMNLVLMDWEKIMENYKKLSIDICLNYFMEHPSYKLLFPSFANIPDEDLIKNRSFKRHSYAIVRSIDSIMSNWSGKYEDENVVLPFIGSSHYQRGVTLDMMHHLKESMLFICLSYLKSNKKHRSAWKLVLDHIFKTYLCTTLQNPNDEEKSENIL